MPNAALAEWLIARFTDGSRAASAVGDLLELAPERGSFWFWWCIARIILSFTWRRLLAFAVACLSLAFVHTLWFRVLLFPLSVTLDAHNSGYFAGSFANFSAFVAEAAVYFAICYGLRDELTRLLFMLFAVSSTAMFSWRIPELVFANLLAIVIIVILSTVSPRRRRALLAAALALGIGFCGFKFILYLWPWYLHMVPLSATGYSLSA